MAFEKADWPRYNHLIKEKYGLKRSGNQFEGPCVVCGGEDRMRILAYDGAVKVHCRVCNDFQNFRKYSTPMAFDPP